MDAEYLKANVGDALAEGLARIAIQKPHDPVEYLGYFLVKRVEDSLREEKVRVLRGLNEGSAMVTSRATRHVPPNHYDEHPPFTHTRSAHTFIDHSTSD